MKYKFQRPAQKEAYGEPKKKYTLSLTETTRAKLHNLGKSYDISDSETLEKLLRDDRVIELAKEILANNETN